MNEVVVVGAARTPIGNFSGMLKDIEPVELSIYAARAALERSGLSPEQVEEVACGMIYKQGFKGNPARQVQIKLNLPSSGFAYTVDQQCASGMKAYEIAVQSIMLGKSDAAVAIGVESMSNAPYVLKGVRNGYRMGDHIVTDSILNDGLVCALMGYHMGVTAENLAKKYKISRMEQDELALLSHQRAVAAQRAGRFVDEIVPIVIQSRKGEIVVDTDEHPRPDISMESLAKLKPAFIESEGTVTAGNASGVNDGAAAIVLMNAQRAKDMGIPVMAKVLSTANVGVDPSIMGIGPVYAIRKALSYAGLDFEDIGYYEINEAFAAQFLACNRELNLDMSKVNGNGSGISLGHPVGCTGVRILVTLIHEMRRRGDTFGLASLCVGGGPAMATVLESV